MRNGALAARIAALARLRGGRGPLAVALTFVLHVATGFIAVAVHYASMWAFMRAGLQPVTASAAGFAGGALARFVLSYVGVFAPTVGVAAGRRALRRGDRSCSSCSTASGSRHCSRSALTVWTAQVAVTIALTFLNFAIYRAWVFR